MFFRRRKIRARSFEERVEGLQQAGFVVSADRTRVTRGGCAAELRDGRIARLGLLVGGELAAVVDAGNQKFLVTDSGHRRPALAAHLKALHAFTEDLRDGLGLASLYHESLGTVNEQHHYDRLEGRA
jgi:hypothetical protein